ncbi:MAG TPA: M23 family metallopeptidase [Gammaproteobacteria bacterium]|nr:M23 family metallopeptidase [Gammaproteobacteria bacterium]
MISIGIKTNLEDTYITEKSLPGNYIILDLGNGKYAGYAHIFPGSFKVKTGDRVTRHQIIAKLGNSGNSSEPHLHFQIIDNNSFLESNGIPYGFKHFWAHSSELLNEENGSMKIKISNEKFKEYANQLVLENALINFED